MATKLRTKIARSREQVSLYVSGVALSTFGVERIRQALEHNFACNLANRCRQPDQTVRERAQCVEARALRRQGGVSLRPNSSSLRIDVQEDSDGIVIHLRGRDVSKVTRTYTNSDLAERVKAAVSCSRANRCGSVSQTPKEQLNCVSVGAVRRFALK